MNVKFSVGEFIYGKFPITATLTYTKMKKVKLQHPKHKWWVERKYESKEITRMVPFTKLTKEEYEAVKNTDLLNEKNINGYWELKKIRRYIRKLI